MERGKLKSENREVEKEFQKESSRGRLFEEGSRRRRVIWCGVDSRTAWTCASMQNYSQLRHNHVVPALTGRCICV